MDRACDWPVRPRQRLDSCCCAPVCEQQQVNLTSRPDCPVHNQSAFWLWSCLDRITNFGCETTEARVRSAVVIVGLPFVDDPAGTGKPRKPVR